VFSDAEGREAVFSENLTSLEAWYADSENPQCQDGSSLTRITGGSLTSYRGEQGGVAQVERLAKFRTLFGIDIDPENGVLSEEGSACHQYLCSVGDALELGFRANCSTVKVLNARNTPEIQGCCCVRSNGLPKGGSWSYLPLLNGD
jgi:hypothetical protein